MQETKISVPERIRPFLEVEDCSAFPIDRYYVSHNEREVLEDIIRMRRYASELKEMGIPYLNSTLLYGKTGTGKTTLGRYVAYQLGLAFAYISFAKLIEGEFGKTSRNLSDIFRFMADTECVLMLDELDCIAVKRGTEASSANGGEMTRITISLMQELDYYKDHNIKSVIIGATNMFGSLDDALVSRFSIPHELKHLTNQEKEEFICLYLNSKQIPYDIGNIRKYCAQNSIITQRNVEADIIQCIIRWIESGKQQYVLEHAK